MIFQTAYPSKTGYAVFALDNLPEMQYNETTTEYKAAVVPRGSVIGKNGAIPSQLSLLYSQNTPAVCPISSGPVSPSWTRRSAAKETVSPSSGQLCCA